ncbi:hypothetical protein ACQ4PT_013422 [Festuca glaucescens]
MNRRFLNLILQDSNTRIRSLYLLDPWKHLFYPSTGKTEAAAVRAEPENQKQDALINPLKLHKPRFRFESDPRVKSMHLFSVLPKESCLLLADSTESAFLYDVDLNAELPIPAMNFPKGPNCVCFSTPHPNPYYPLDTHCLYVLDLSPATAINTIGSSFEVLNYFSSDHFSTPQLSPSYKNSYYWQSLPQPPLAGDKCSSMMVGGSTICVSSVEEGVGAYTFDMLNKVWTCQVGNEWVMPFYGKAEYVPELSLYFALSADSPRRLCALDCASTTPPAGPPTLRHTFDCLDHLPEKWSTYKSHLANLGSGSFCIVSLCENMKRQFAVFTGVEVKPCNDGGGPLRMIRHLSERYNLGSHSVKCAL